MSSTSYDLFCKWFHKSKHKNVANPTKEGEKIFLTCLFCPFKVAVSFTKEKYGDVSNFKKHYDMYTNKCPELKQSSDGSLLSVDTTHDVDSTDDEDGIYATEMDIPITQNDVRMDDVDGQSVSMSNRNLNESLEVSPESSVLSIIAELQDKGILLVYRLTPRQKKARKNSLTSSFSTNSSTPASNKEGKIEEDVDAMYITCDHCLCFSCQVGRSNNWVFNTKEHFFGAPHDKASKQLKLTSMYQQSSGIHDEVKLSHYKDPRMATLCLGYRPVSGSVEEKVLINFKVTMDSEFSTLVRANPIVVTPIDGKNNFKTVYGGSCFKSNRCLEITPFTDRPFPNFECSSCASIPFLRQFKREVDKRKKGLCTSRPIKWEHRDILEHRYRNNSKRLAIAVKTIHQNAKLKARGKPSIEKVLKSYAADGQVEKFVYSLVRAIKDGKIKETSAFFQTTNDTVLNAHRKKQGRRYSLVNQKVMSILRMRFSSAASNVYSTITGASSSAAYRHQKKLEVPFKSGLCKENFEIVDKIYQNEMKIHGITSSVIASYAVDETPINRFIGFTSVWDTDTTSWKWILNGFCGFRKGQDPNNESHKCFGCHPQLDTMLTVRNLDNIVDCYEKLQIATAMSAQIIQPMHNRLSNICVSIQPTCMQFDKNSEKERDRILTHLYNQTVAVTFKYPLSGDASDGTGTRVTSGTARLSMINTDRSPRDKYHRLTLPDCPQIGFGGRLVDSGTFGWVPPSPDKKYCIKLHTQDPKHCLKKFFNSIQSLKALVFGEHGCTISIQIIADEVGRDAHAGQPYCIDLLNAHEALKTHVSSKQLSRLDRMNVSHIQNLMKMDVQNLLQNSPMGAAAEPTRFALKCIWRFRMMFYALHIPLSERIKYCGYVITFLFAWYHFVDDHSQLSISKNFVTMNTFRDIIITCNSFILYLKIGREERPHEEFSTTQMGSDSCETFFSQMGGWGTVHSGERDTTYQNAVLMHKKLVALKGMAGDSNEEGIHVTTNRAHIHNSESIELEKDELDLGYNKDTQRELMGAFDDHLIRQLLQCGTDQALEDVRSFRGITPKCNDPGTLFDYSIIIYKNQEDESDSEADEGNDNEGRHDNDDGNDSEGNDSEGGNVSDCAHEEQDNDMFMSDDDTNVFGHDDDENPDDNEGDGYCPPILVANLVRRPSNEIPLVNDRDDQTLAAAEEDEDMRMIQALEAIDDENSDMEEPESESEHNSSVAENSTSTAQPLARAKRPSRYQVPISNGKTANIRTILSTLTLWATSGQSTSKDRARKIMESAKFSKKEHIQELVSNHERDQKHDLLYSGSFISVLFDSDGYKFWLGMVQRIISRPIGRKACIRTTPICLDDADISTTWLNVAWLQPCSNGAAFAYEWILPFDDASEVSAQHVISLPNLYFEDRIKCYKISEGQLSDITEYVHTVSTIQEDAEKTNTSKPSKPSRNPSSGKRSKVALIVPEDTYGGPRKVVQESSEGKRRRTTYVL